MRKKSIRTLLPAVMLCVTLSAFALPAHAAAGPDPLAIDLSRGTTLSVSVDGSPVKVTQYKVTYVAKPVAVRDGDATTEDFQSMYIYVPENAKPSSAVILYVVNSGWMGWKAAPRLADGDKLNSASSSVAAAVKAGYVFVSAGSRSRQAIGATGPAPMRDRDGAYVGHSPAAVADAKAAVRYLRLNDAALPGSAERIFITGTSGGGALSAAVAASGNSPEYYPYLYEIGAAGMTAADASVIRDDVFGTVAYCPITDLEHADQAYEWQYGDLRANNAVTTAGAGISDGGRANAAMLAASAELAADYAPYFNGLGLKLEDGKALTTANLADTIRTLVKKEVEYALKNVGKDRMFNADMTKIRVSVTDAQTGAVTVTEKDNTWIKNIDLDKGTADVDYDAYRLFVAQNTPVKIAPAFDNVATPLQGQQNETNLYGTTAQEYHNFEFWCWNNNNVKGDGVGKDDTGLDWNAFIGTEAGKALSLQMRLSNPIPYLTGAAKSDHAPYWYLRHGLLDRDTSFAIETELYYAVKNAANVKDVNFKFAWLQGHAGDYDVPEAYAWIASVLANNASPTSVSEIFSDVSAGAWYAGSVQYAYDRSLMDGVGGDRFNPSGTLSRAMVATLLYRADGQKPAANAGSFSDVTAGAWYANAVSWASANKVVAGYDDGTFRPDRAVSREEMAVMLARYGAYRGLTSETTARPAFADAGDVASWATDAVALAEQTGLMTGKNGNRFDPKSGATRAEAAAILMRVSTAAGK